MLPVLYRHLYTCACLLILLGFAPASLMAQAENLKVDVEAGFSGDYRAGKWVPIFVTIANQPPPEKSINDIEDFKGRITLSSQPTGDSDPVQFVREVDVPKASSKRFVLYGKFPQDIPPGRVPEIRLSTESGKYLAQYPLNVLSVPMDKTIVARVTSGSQQIALPSFRDQYADTARYGGINPDLLTDHWAAYDSANIVLFSSWPAKSLRPEVVEALRQWVAMGGTLVFATGRETQSYSDEESRKLLPVTINGTRRMEEQSNKFHITADSSGAVEGAAKAYILCDATPTANAEVLLQVENIPLIVREKIGRGQVVFFANDLQSDSRVLERLLMPAWQSISPLPNLASAEGHLPETLQKFQTLTGRAARPPNQFIIILICVIYTVIVGPLNFAILAKKKKLELAWITLPVIVLFFFFFIYGVGKLTKGNNDIIREVTINRFTQHSPIGSSFTVVGTFVSNPANHYFRPVNNHFSLEDAFGWSPGHSFLGPQNMMPFVVASSAASRMNAAPTTTFDPRSGQLYVSSLKMGTYDAQNFILRGPVDRKGEGIKAKVAWKGAGLVGTITNATGDDFDQSWLAVGNSLMPLGGLKNGEAHSLDDKFILNGYSRSTSSQSGVRRSYMNGPDEFDALRKEYPSTDEEANKSNLGLIMASMYRPQNTGIVFPPEGGTISFIGVRNADSAKEEVTSIQPTIQSSVHVTMVEINATPFSDEQFTVMDAYLKKRLVAVDEERASRGFEVDNASMKLTDASVVISYELPFSDPSLKVTSFRIQPVGKAAEYQVLSVEVLRWGGSVPRWDPVDQTIEILNTDVALPGTGRMYIRITSREKDDQKASQVFSSNVTTIDALNVSMKGVVEK
ncbi:hypothetical protein IT570_02215 [Candidatus Sumerlaeota bacterium]|nr:hypothetical protein [Candidatus Sumerlaeota bacterium]